ncbi:hypothetical protein [Pyrococcus kukulkanii]|uniref:hypothetical protein n=1 Tax=Pyrococcus kukulkanii TaxID=1609559 RepID=UPI0035636AAD
MNWLEKVIRYGMLRSEKLVVENILEKLKYEYNGQLFRGNLKSFVQEVAEASGVHTNTVYYVIRRLKELGILEEAIVNGKDYIVLSKRFSSRMIKLGREYSEWLKT